MDMQNQLLADWLEPSLERLVPETNDLGLVLCESILRVTSTGEIDMLASVVGGAAQNAVATSQPVANLLEPIHSLKKTICERLEEEVDPSLAWDMLFSLEAIFEQLISLSMTAYIEALSNAHQAREVESARTHETAKKQVLEYIASLSKANRELSKIEKAKTDFISIAAHELKTPLSVVVGYIKLLEEQQQEIFKQDMELAFKGLLNGTARLETIINNLLDISALETNSLALSPSPVSVRSLVKTIFNKATEEAETRQQRYSLEIGPDIPVIFTDGQRLGQALYQVLNNAIKYTPDESCITVRVGLQAEDEVHPPFIKIEIDDDGIGIAPEDREQVFDKFYRVGNTDLHSTGYVKFKGAGPGLGLSMAKGIIESLNGKIWLESPGHDEVNFPGTTCHICLPLS